jgi:hypothetical protein
VKFANNIEKRKEIGETVTEKEKEERYCREKTGSRRVTDSKCEK